MVATTGRGKSQGSSCGGWSKVNLPWYGGEKKRGMNAAPVNSACPSLILEFMNAGRPGAGKGGEKKKKKQEAAAAKHRSWKK